MTDREWAAPESSSLSSWRTRLTSALPTLHGTSMFIDCGHSSRSDPTAGTGHAPTVVTRPSSIRVSRRCPIGHQVDNWLPGRLGDDEDWTGGVCDDSGRDTALQMFQQPA